MTSKSCLKIVLITINTLLLLACAGLMYVGVWSLREYSNYGYLIPTVYMIGLPVGIIFFVGSLIFVVAVVGIVATSSEAKCLIATYCTMLLVTFVLLIAGIGLLYACEHMVVGRMDKNLDKGLQEYFLDPNVTKEVDYLQQSRKCCGVWSFTDWVGTPWYNNQTFTNESFYYPKSCCPNEICEFDEFFFESDSSNATNSTNSTTPSVIFSTNVFRKGCYPELSHLLHSKFVISMSVSASVAAILIVGFAMICALYNRRASDFEYIGFVDDDAVRV
jgi:hypothetical protein